MSSLTTEPSGISSLNKQINLALAVDRREIYTIRYMFSAREGEREIQTDRRRMIKGE